MSWLIHFIVATLFGIGIFLICERAKKRENAVWMAMTLTAFAMVIMQSTF